MARRKPKYEEESASIWEAGIAFLAIIFLIFLFVFDDNFFLWWCNPNSVITLQKKCTELFSSVLVLIP